jgi:hypothetical protein
MLVGSGFPAMKPTQNYTFRSEEGILNKFTIKNYETK